MKPQSFVLAAAFVLLAGLTAAAGAADTVSPAAAVKPAEAAPGPVAQARASGMPSLVDFGAKGCRPCDMLAPILDTLRTKYAGKMNVLFVNVREEPALAAQYGIEFIPVQVFFDKSGKEVFRHTGFWPQEEIEKKAAEMGVQAP